MIHLKTLPEIETMKKGGVILSEVLTVLLNNAKKGISLANLEKIASEELVKRGAQPSFKKVKGYHWTICTSVNDVVVHGIPDDYLLKDGDIVGIDCGAYYQGFNTDAAWTIEIGNNKNEKTNSFLSTGQKALSLAIREVKLGNYIYDISSVIQETIEGAGYSIVEILVGHGIGKKLHEEPEIPGYIKGSREETPKIVSGMALAIEIIYNMGGKEVVYKNDDGWTIGTKDGKLSGLFEATVVASPHGCLVLTPLKGISL